MENELELFTQGELYEIRRDMRLERSTDFWRRTFYSSTPFFSKHKQIMFADIEGTRAMAPFALPSSQGIPIFKERGMSIESFLPAYIKLLDAVRPEDATTMTPMELVTGNKLTMQARFEARTAEVSRQHRRSTERTWDFMAARAVIDGRLTMKYEHEQGAPFPEVTIDFGRDPNHTIAFGSGVDWAPASADIYGDIQEFIDIVRKAKFGGNLNRMIVGSNVAPVFQRNESVLDKLDTNIRGGEGTRFTRGLQYYNEDNNEPTFLGVLGGAGGAIEVYAYSDQQMDNAGNMIDVLDPNDVLLTAGGVAGVMAFGAIYDVRTLNTNVDIFQKMYVNENPSQINLLTQSAPLPIPRYPNRTLKATVLDPTP